MAMADPDECRDRMAVSRLLLVDPKRTLAKRRKMSPNDPRATSNVVGLRAVLLCMRVLSFRQLFARLLSHHVGGVPVWPVRVALPNTLLVHAVSGLRAPKRARQVACGAEGSRARC